MKKLLKITEIATVSKSAKFPNQQRCQFQILIVQIENLNKYQIKKIKNKFYVPIFQSFREMSRQRTTVEPVRIGFNRAGSSF